MKFKPKLIISNFLQNSASDDHKIVSAVSLPTSCEIQGNPDQLVKTLNSLLNLSTALYQSSCLSTYTYFRVTQMAKSIEIQALSGGRRLCWNQFYRSPLLIVKFWWLKILLAFKNYHFSFKPLARGTLLSVKIQM